ncbi:uncharacterized protein LOC130636936 [Hydractinia symbiolongicarpus]|uniref:uncharacterized protein LOC130636936 n=1 Tax=Hydractinia symbiolongicarpus TaxID=13093 RepID=UPI00254AF152|nr:uncharacterized protein LOC130636936 [Hydractinia symbiolongicarpus]
MNKALKVLLDNFCWNIVSRGYKTERLSSTLSVTLGYRSNFSFNLISQSCLNANCRRKKARREKSWNKADMEEAVTEISAGSQIQPTSKKYGLCKATSYDNSLQKRSPWKELAKSIHEKEQSQQKKANMICAARKSVTSNPFIIYDFYDTIEKLFNEKQYTLAQVWNCDEWGFLTDPSRAKVIGPKGKVANKLIWGEGHENISTLAACSAVITEVKVITEMEYLAKLKKIDEEAKQKEEKRLNRKRTQPSVAGKRPTIKKKIKFGKGNGNDSSIEESTDEEEEKSTDSDDENSSNESNNSDDSSEDDDESQKEMTAEESLLDLWKSLNPLAEESDVIQKWYGCI